MLLFGVCFVLYFIKLSPGKGICFLHSVLHKINNCIKSTLL